MGLRQWHELRTWEAIEQLYYTSPDYEPICFYYGVTELPSSVNVDCYPQCVHCASKPSVNRK